MRDLWVRLRASFRQGRRVRIRRPLITEPLEPRLLLAAERFAVIGDYGSAGANERAVANLVKSWAPDLIITTGDNNYPNGAASTIDQNIGQYYAPFIGNYGGQYGSGSATNRFFPSLGNHDWNTPGAQPYLNYFTLPGNERYYDFVHGSVHFYAVDSDTSEPDGASRTSAQADWLRTRLASSTSPFDIVYLHHAPYSSGGSHGSTARMQWPFKEWGAEAVLAGHDHLYERLNVGGLPYFVNGLGGRSIYPFSSPIAGSQFRYNADYGAMLVTATSTSLKFQFYSVTNNGTLIDEYTIGATNVAPTLSISDVTVTEGNSGTTTNATFTVTLSPASTQTVSVSYATANDTAIAGLDYSTESGTLTFNPNVTTQTISVSVIGEAVDENTERFFVNLSGPTNATIADGQGVGTILDDDPTVPGLPSLSINDVSVTEGDSGTTNADFTVSLSAPSTQTVSVAYSTANDTATAGLDYTSKSGTLTFNPNVTTQTITVSVTGDTAIEALERFRVNLTSPTNATLSDAQGVGTIFDDDTTVPQLFVSDTSVTEGNSGTTTATFTVSLSFATIQTVTVQYMTSNDTAAAGFDYTSKIGLLTFGPNVTTQLITVSVIPDTLAEIDEQFRVTLFGATNATIGDPQGVGTILDDDRNPAISITDTSVVEGNSGVRAAVFTVRLSFATTQAVSVQYLTLNSTAIAGSDYTAKSGTLTFAPNVLTQTITVSVSGDIVAEGDEQFFVSLTSPTNAILADAQALGTILDDDGVVVPELSISDTSVTEGSAGGAVFQVRLSAGTTSIVTVRYATSDGSATAGSDYQTTSGTLTFNPGVTMREIPVPLLSGGPDSQTEDFFIQLSSPTNAAIGDGLAVGTIVQVTANSLSFQDGVSGYSGTRDTVIRQSNPARNFGASKTLNAGGNPKSAALLRWDVSQIAPGSVIQSASITLNVVDPSVNSFDLYAVKRNWIESEATWNAFSAGNNWQAAGAQGSDDRDPLSLGSFTATATGTLTIQLNARGIALVQSWVNNSTANYGITIQNYLAADILGFRSSESTGTRQPKLTVTFVPA